MNKIISLFLTLIFMTICGNVFADYAPEALEYEVKVSNPQGTILWGYSSDYDSYVEKRKLVYGERGTISFIEEFDNDLYARFENENEWGMVLFKDLSRTKPWDMSEFIFGDYKWEETILNKNGVEIYEWPSKLEKVIGKIPYGTTIECKMANNEGYWFYLTYNGVSGWIYAKDESTGELYTKLKLMTTWKGASILDINRNEIGKIPANTVINEYYLANNSHNWNRTYYLTYNGISGYIDINGKYDDEVVVFDNKKFIYTVDYDNAILIGTNNEIIDIPKGTELEIKEPWDWDYCLLTFTSFSGKDGWIFMPQFVDDYELQEAIKDAKDYIKYGKSNLNKKDNTKNVIDDNNENKIIKKSSKMSAKQIVIICVISSLIIAIITTVIIIVVNKNKNKNRE